MQGKDKPKTAGSNSGVADDKQKKDQAAAQADKNKKDQIEKPIKTKQSKGKATFVCAGNHIKVTA